MNARDVMVSPVITVKSSATVKDVATLLVTHRISAVPVVDDQGKLIGMISEGDLLHRTEAGTERQRSWWLRLLAGEQTLAADYVKANAKKVADVMSRKVVSAGPETPLHEIAALMERNSIKRVPIVGDGRLVGIVSRANLVQALASAKTNSEVSLSDAAIREKLLAHLSRQPWAHTPTLSVIVHDGVVDVWGQIYSESERDAIRTAIENIPGVRSINDNLAPPPIGPMY